MAEAIFCPIAADIRRQYDEYGWIERNGVTHDARSCEDLRPAAAEYVTACRMRVKRHLPATGHRLIDMGSGPIQYPEYLTYSEGFAIRTCVDLSTRALSEARRKLGGRGEYLCGDFLDIDVPQADAAVSLHTVYHIAADRQEAAVRKLLQCLRPGGTAVIVYSNPAYPISVLLGPLRRLLNRRAPSIYMHRHPLRWWRRFETAADVRILPWRTFPAREQRMLGRRALAALFRLEERFPAFFARWGCYYLVALTRHR
jgi:SAM-dependent methyltransferase